MNDEKKKEKYRIIFSSLPLGMQKACRELERRENWGETTWIETLEALMGMFEDYRDAERWIRSDVLAKFEGVKP